MAVNIEVVPEEEDIIPGNNSDCLAGGLVDDPVSDSDTKGGGA